MHCIKSGWQKSQIKMSCRSLEKQTVKILYAPEKSRVLYEK